MEMKNTQVKYRYLQICTAQYTNLLIFTIAVNYYLLFFIEIPIQLEEKVMPVLLITQLKREADVNA